MAKSEKDRNDERINPHTKTTEGDKGRTLVGAVGIPSDTVAPNGVRITEDGAVPAQGVVSAGNTDDPQHILVVDPRAAGAPENVNKGVPEDEGGSNPPAFNSDGLRPDQQVDFETISRVNRENDARSKTAKK